MGTIYCGPFADAIDSYRHEGYAARILPDGTETGSWTYETREFTGYRAHCDCGWRGTATYPPTERGEELADEEWDRDHLEPLINTVATRTSVPADMLLGVLGELRGSLDDTVNGRGERVLTARSVGVLQAAERVEQLVAELAGE